MRDVCKYCKYTDCNDCTVTQLKTQVKGITILLLQSLTGHTFDECEKAYNVSNMDYSKAYRLLTHDEHPPKDMV